MKREETNEEFMARIMRDGCPTGLLIHAFILQALETYSKAVISAPVQCCDGVVSGEAWKRTADWLQGEIDKHLGRTPAKPEVGAT